MTTFAWLSPSDSTAMILGFNKLVCIGFPFQYPRLVTPIRLTGNNLKINSRGAPLRDAIRVPRPSIRLPRIQFDDQAFVDIASDVAAFRLALERAFELLRIDSDPACQTTLFSQRQLFDDTPLLLRLFADSNDVTRLNLHRRDVRHHAVHRDRLMAHELTRFSARRAEAHAIHDVVETRLEQLQQVFTRVALEAVGFSEITAELALENAVDALHFLLFAQLRAVVGRTGTRGAAMLARLAVKLAL